MTGVEILATQNVATAFGFCWTGFICLVFAGLIFVMFLVILVITIVSFIIKNRK
jgi:hypothetical protein